MLSKVVFFPNQLLFSYIMVFYFTEVVRMVVLLKKPQKNDVSSKEDSFGEYIARSTENTTVNGASVVRKFSWYKRIMGLF